MKKQNVKRSVMIAAACLTLGMQAQPLMAEEAEVATELTTEAAAEAAAEEAVEIESEAVESAELTLEETEAENDAEAAAYSYDELTVGAATAFDGNFFTEMWGNVVSDLDVRTLIHGYDLVEWVSADGIFRLDPSVVSGTVVTENAAGDRTYTISLSHGFWRAPRRSTPWAPLRRTFATSRATMPTGMVKASPSPASASFPRILWPSRSMVPTCRSSMKQPFWTAPRIPSA